MNDTEKGGSKYINEKILFARDTLLTQEETPGQQTTDSDAKSS